MFGKNKDKVDYEIFSIYDSKVDAYEMPMFAINQHDLTRQILNNFKDTSQHKTNKFFLNAEDFSLFRIGAYTKKSGTLLTQNPEHIANLHELRAAAQQEGH